MTIKDLESEEDTDYKRTLAIEKFREEHGSCSNIFDLFAFLWKLADGRVDFLSSEQEFEPTALFDLEIRRSDGAIPLSVQRYLDVPKTSADLLEGLDVEVFLHRSAAVLRSIDMAAESLNDFRSDPHPDWKRTLASLHYSPYQLNPKSPGIVTLKPAQAFGDRQGETQWWTDALASEYWANLLPRGQHLSHLLQNLLWISPVQGVEIDYKRLARQRTAADHVRWDKLRVGYVPLVEKVDVANGRFSPGNVVLRRSAHPERRFEILEMVDVDQSQALCDAAESALRLLAARGCQLVLYPEAVVPDTVVSRLQQVLKELCVDRKPRPHLVLAGTFGRARTEGGKVFNTAVVLGSHGQFLCQQRKMHRYAMADYEQERYGLKSVLNPDQSSKPVEEDISTADRVLSIRDLGGSGIRLVIAICEDSTQLQPLWFSLLQAMPNLVLTPVMAGALLKTRGFYDSSAKLSGTVGAISAVVNSASLPRRESPESHPPFRPLGLMGLPLQSASTHGHVCLLDDQSAATGEPTTLYVEFPFRPGSLPGVYL